MRLINAELKLNEYHQKAVRGLTPAEVVVLRTMHDVQAGGCCVKNPVAAGEKTSFVNAAGEKKPWTNGEEVARLKSKYRVRGKSGQPGTHLVDDLFPGANPDLPDTFSHPMVGLKVAVPGEAAAEAAPLADARIIQLEEENKRLRDEAEKASKTDASKRIEELEAENAKLKGETDPKAPAGELKPAKVKPPKPPKPPKARKNNDPE